MKHDFQYAQDEMLLIRDEALIRRKNQLLEKIEKQLMILGKSSAKSYPELSAISPLLKVSKGEKHQGLPFLVLDYPRIFGRKNIFAIRTLIWWGKQLSISLILKGSFLQEQMPQVKKRLTELSDDEIYLSTSGDLWSNELKKRYDPQKELDKEVEFLKISYKLPLTALNHLGDFYEKTFDKLLSFTDYAKD